MNQTDKEGIKVLLAIFATLLLVIFFVYLVHVILTLP